jgi:hypothetical protein
MIAGHAPVAPAAGAGGAGAGNLHATPEQLLLEGEAVPPKALAIRPFATLEALGTVPRLWEEWKFGLGPGSTPVQTYANDPATRDAACERAQWKRQVRPARAVRADYAFAQLNLNPLCCQAFRKELSKRTVLTRLITRLMDRGASEADAVAAVEAQRVASGAGRWPGSLDKLWRLVSKGGVAPEPLALLPAEDGGGASADAAAA